MLFSVTARVFTGAAEAQVNFTSLFVDQHLLSQDEPNQKLLLHGLHVKSATGASSIPEKHHTYATYKKYISPDKSFAVEITQSPILSFQHQQIGFSTSAHIHKPIFLPQSNSPPVDVFAHSHTHTSTADASAVLENYFGKIEVNNNFGGLGSI